MKGRKVRKKCKAEHRVKQSSIFIISTAWKSCNTTVDVAFIIDSSGSIARRNYVKIKTFVKYVARSFGISPSGSRAGIVLYSTSASVKAQFGQYPTTEEFVKAVDSLPHERGLTYIDRALNLAASQLFPRARKNVPKLAMLLTDGRQTDPLGTVNLREASAPLRNQGVRVVAFGVGKSINVRELRLTVERDEDVIIVMKFDDLINKVRTYTANLCQAAGKRNLINPEVWGGFESSVFDSEERIFSICFGTILNAAFQISTSVNFPKKRIPGA